MPYVDGYPEWSDGGDDSCLSGDLNSASLPPAAPVLVKIWHCSSRFSQTAETA
jgi:hypothetical protein